MTLTLTASSANRAAYRGAEPQLVLASDKVADVKRKLPVT